MFRSIWRRLSALLRRDRLARELDEELHEHYAALHQQLEDEGLSARDAGWWRGCAWAAPRRSASALRVD